MAFTALLVAGLCGLAVAAVGTAHQLMPRQFTAAQQRKIMTWEMTRRWRAISAGKIFPATVSYKLSGQAFYAAKGLSLSAQRLGIDKSTSCKDSLSRVAARILARDGCTAVLRATYIDSSDSLVATVGVAVLPDAGAANAAASELSTSHSASPQPLQALRVHRTLAAGFGAKQQEVSKVTAAGSYVILATAGFSDGRPNRIKITSDYYLDHELVSLAAGLSASARSVVGIPPPLPTCPGAPGC